VAGANAQSQPTGAEQGPSRPLNLSVRKPGPAPDPAVLILIDQPTAASIGNEDASAPANLPYGAGYESRQQGSTAGSGNASGSSGSSGSGGAGGGGNGGGGRGGSGRGR